MDMELREDFAIYGFHTSNIARPLRSTVFSLDKNHRYTE